MSPPIDILSKMLLHAAPIIIPIGKPKQQKYIFFHTSHALHTNAYAVLTHSLIFFRTSPKGTTTKMSDAFCSSFLGGLSLVRVSPTHSGDGWVFEVQKGPFFPPFFWSIKLLSLHFHLYSTFSFHFRTCIHSSLIHTLTHSSQHSKTSFTALHTHTQHNTQQHNNTTTQQHNNTTTHLPINIHASWPGKNMSTITLLAPARSPRQPSLEQTEVSGPHLLDTM